MNTYCLRNSKVENLRDTPIGCGGIFPSTFLIKMCTKMHLLTDHVTIEEQDLRNWCNLALKTHGIVVPLETVFHDLDFAKLCTSPSTRMLMLALYGQGVDFATSLDGLSDQEKRFCGTIWVLFTNTLLCNRVSGMICDHPLPNLAETSTWLPIWTDGSLKWMQCVSDAACRMEFSQEMAEDMIANSVGWPSQQYLKKTGASVEEIKRNLSRNCFRTGIWTGCVSRIHPSYKLVNHNDFYKILISRNTAVSLKGTTEYKFTASLPSLVARQLNQGPNIDTVLPSANVYGWSTTFLLLFGFSWLVSTGLACPVVNDTQICTLMDYIHLKNLTHSEPGKYLVCFDDECILRFRDSNGFRRSCPNMENCSIWPYRCPSPDWNPPIAQTEDLVQCRQCGGIPYHDICLYNGNKRSQYEINVVLPWCDYRVKEGFEPGCYIKPGEEWIVYNGYVFEGRYLPPKEWRVAANEDKPTTQMYVSHDRTPPEVVKLRLHPLIAGILATVAVLLSLLTVINFKKKVKVEDDDNTVELNDRNLTLVEDTLFTVKSVHLPRWLNYISIILLLCSLTTLAVADYSSFNTRNLDPFDQQDLPDIYRLPSGCTCSDDGDNEPFTNCVLPCNAKTRMGYYDVELDFSLITNCNPKKLVVLDEYWLKKSRGCIDASDEDLGRECKHSNYCEVYDHSLAGFGPDIGNCRKYCAFGSNTYTMAEWHLSVFEAEVCTYNTNSEGSIKNFYYEYTARIDSILLNQHSVVRAMVNGKENIYKYLNGGIGSTRAWVVNSSDVTPEGEVNESSYLYRQLMDLAQPQDLDCGKGWKKIALEEFHPTSMETYCRVEISYSGLHCPKGLATITKGRYTVVGNTTLLTVDTDGMLEGVSVGAGEQVTMPSSWYKCANCVASKFNCSDELEYINDNACLSSWWHETSDDSFTQYNTNSVLREINSDKNQLFKCISLIIVIIGSIVILMVTSRLIFCLCHR